MNMNIVLGKLPIVPVPRLAFSAETIRKRTLRASCMLSNVANVKFSRQPIYVHALLFSLLVQCHKPLVLGYLPCYYVHL